ncbi:MAG: ATP synthase subunit delta [Porticoccaceae bacterium]|nr:MAG: ATP synthase subunit delta [Porticoccaceae bacterium]
MADPRTLARPYAKAIYRLAVEQGSLERWEAALELLARLVEEPRVARYLASPAHGSREQAATLAELAGEYLDEPARNLLELLAEYRRLPLLPEVLAQFRALKAERDQTLEVELVSATELGEEQCRKIEQALERRFARRVRSVRRTDPFLLGGVLIRAGDTVIDGTLRGRLKKLAQALHG